MSIALLRRCFTVSLAMPEAVLLSAMSAVETDLNCSLCSVLLENLKNGKTAPTQGLTWSTTLVLQFHEYELL